MARKTPLCMASYKYLFNATRLPTAPSDTAKTYDPDSHNHVVVVRKNKFYEVPVVDDKGEWLSEKELETWVAALVAPLTVAKTERSRRLCLPPGSSSRWSRRPARRQTRTLSARSPPRTATCGPRCALLIPGRVISVN